MLPLEAMYRRSISYGGENAVKNGQRTFQTSPQLPYSIAVCDKLNDYDAWA